MNDIYHATLLSTTSIFNAYMYPTTKVTVAITCGNEHNEVYKDGKFI